MTFKRTRRCKNTSILHKIASWSALIILVCVTSVANYRLLRICAAG